MFHRNGTFQGDVPSTVELFVRDLTSANNTETGKGIRIELFLLHMTRFIKTVLIKRQLSRHLHQVNYIHTYFTHFDITITKGPKITLSKGTELIE